MATRQLVWNPQKIRAIREALHLSPERFAAIINEFLAVGVSGRKVRRWEAGGHAPNARELVAICHAFHLEIGTLFSDTDEKPLPERAKTKSRAG